MSIKLTNMSGIDYKFLKIGAKTIRIKKMSRKDLKNF